METPTSDRASIAVSHATRDRINSIAEASSCSQNEVVAAGIDALTHRTLAASGVVRLELIRSLETLETTVALAAETNVRLAEICSLVCDGRLAQLEQALARARVVTKGGK